jgi:hypothetical protein
MQCTVRLVALELAQVGLRMIPNPRNQFEPVRQPYEVIVRAHGEGEAFDLRLFLGR